MPVGTYPSALVVRGNAGCVHRIDPRNHRQAVPMAPIDCGSMVDVWVMPGEMHIVAVRGSTDTYAIVLCYVDHVVRDVCKAVGLDESLAVDVWHIEPLRHIEGNDTQVRAVCRHLAHAAAQGAVAFEPIRPEQRQEWATTIRIMTALVTQKHV